MNIPANSYVKWSPKSEYDPHFWKTSPHLCLLLFIILYYTVVEYFFLSFSTDDRNKTWPNNDKRESNMKREIVNNNFKPGPKQINQINNVSQNDMQNIQEMSSPPVRIVKPTRSISGGGGDDMVRGRGITRSRGWKSAGRPNPTPDTQKRKNISQAHDNGHEYIMSQNFINKNMNSSQQQAAPPIVEEVERGMSNMSVREPLSGRSGGHNRQTSSVPPRLQGQEAQRQVAPKRYSSLRQRSLPETAGMATGGAVPPQQQPPPAAASAFTPHPHPPPPTIIHYTPHGKFPKIYKSCYF